MVCDLDYPFVRNSRALKGWLQTLDHFSRTCLSLDFTVAWSSEPALPATDSSMSEREGFFLWFLQRRLLQTAAQEIFAWLMAFWEQNRRKGHYLKFQETHLEILIHLWAQCPEVGSFSNLILLENKSLSWLYRVSQEKWSSVTRPLPALGFSPGPGPCFRRYVKFLSSRFLGGRVSWLTFSCRTPV